MNALSPPNSAIKLGTGGEQQVEGVAEHHLVAESGDVTGLERLDRTARGERDERGRPHVTVREAQRAGARA